jgi:hypothetical protein
LSAATGHDCYLSVVKENIAYVSDDGEYNEPSAKAAEHNFVESTNDNDDYNTSQRPIPKSDISTTLYYL